MINLDFDLDLGRFQAKGPLTSLDSLEGIQTFNTEQTDFSMTIPVFWFAKHLRRVEAWTAETGLPYYAYALDFDWGICFWKEGNCTWIVDWEGMYSECWRVYSGGACVNTDELTSAIRAYIKRLNAFLQGYPNICTSREYNAWFSETPTVDVKAGLQLPPLEFLMKQLESYHDLPPSFLRNPCNRIWLEGMHFRACRFVNQILLDDHFAVYSEKTGKFIPYAYTEQFSTYKRFISLSRSGFPPDMLEESQLLTPVLSNNRIVQLVELEE